jgi:hypothetical protein
MTYHPSSAVSVATILIAAAFVAVVGYRTGRAHAALRDLRAAKRDVPVKRRLAWGHLRGLTFGSLILLAALFAAGYHASH